MDENIPNRMSSPNKRGRGRPPKEEVENRPAPIEAGPVPLPVGWICPCCGRGMVPKVLRSVSPGLKYCSCTLCGKGFKLYTQAGRWMGQAL